MGLGPKQLNRQKTENKKQNRRGDKAMKTTNKQSETRGNKFRNAFLKGAAIVTSFVLISFTVSAQSFWKQILTESSFGNVAMIMAGTKGAKPAVEKTTALTQAESTLTHVIAEEADQPLALEPWMTDDSFFSNQEVTVSQETEPSLELEDWMTNSKYFSSETTVKEDSDEELNLENWMTNNKYWRI